MQKLGDLLIEAGYIGVNRSKKRSATDKYRNPRDREKRRQVVALDPICRYCMEAESTTADHVLPVCRGGKNNYLNLVGCCNECNQIKADMLPHEAGMVLHLPARMIGFVTFEGAVID